MTWSIVINPTTKTGIYKFQRASDKKHLSIKPLRKNSPRYWPKDAQTCSTKEKSDFYKKLTVSASVANKIWSSSYSFNWVSDFEIRNSKRLDQWKALWKYQLGQLNEIERIVDKATFRDGQEKQFSRDWYWSYERTTWIMFPGSGSHDWFVCLKWGACSRWPFRPISTRGSIETKTIRKTRLTLLVGRFCWQILVVGEEFDFSSNFGLPLAVLDGKRRKGNVVSLVLSIKTVFCDNWIIKSK